MQTCIFFQKIWAREKVKGHLVTFKTLARLKDGYSSCAIHAVLVMGDGSGSPCSFGVAFVHLSKKDLDDQLHERLDGIVFIC